MTAIAQEAIRARTLSARLVRMIGTRAPRTIPAASALAMKVARLPDNLYTASIRGFERITQQCTGRRQDNGTYKQSNQAERFDPGKPPDKHP